MPQLVAVTQIPKTCAEPHCSKRPRVTAVMTGEEPGAFELAHLCLRHFEGLRRELEEEGQQS